MSKYNIVVELSEEDIQAAAFDCLGIELTFEQLREVHLKLSENVQEHAQNELVELVSDLFIDEATWNNADGN